jgi:proline racemase
MDSFGAIVLPPIDKRAEFSLIFMNTLGYMYMCGHATIGVAGAFSNWGISGWRSQRQRYHLRRLQES